MKNECSIARDLLPLYAENMLSTDTSDFVKEHLAGCKSCREKYELMREPHPTQKTSDTAPLLKLKKKMKIKKIQTVLLTAVFAVALLVSTFAVLDAPAYFPYSEDLIAVEPVGDCGLRITFDKSVTDFDYDIYPDPDGGNFYYCDIQAWSSLWDKWFSGRTEALSATVLPKEPYPVVVEYLPNDGSESVCIYGNSESTRAISLPRLSLGYFLILATASLAVLIIVWLLIRKKLVLRTWTERIGLYPISYIVSHCIVSGINWSTYSLPRDFSLIVFISTLLYIFCLLVHNVCILKKEIAENKS